MKEKIETYDNMTFSELIELQKWLIDLHGKKFDHYEQIPDRLAEEYGKITSLIFDIEEIMLKRVEKLNHLSFNKS